MVTGGEAIQGGGGYCKRKELGSENGEQCLKVNAFIYSIRSFSFKRPQWQQASRSSAPGTSRRLHVPDARTWLPKYSRTKRPQVEFVSVVAYREKNSPLYTLVLVINISNNVAVPPTCFQRLFSVFSLRFQLSLSGFVTSWKLVAQKLAQARYLALSKNNRSFLYLF